jgi:(2S)-methylsuccinyl-CoA dehydrogenase
MSHESFERALEAAREVVAAMGRGLAAKVGKDGKLSRGLLDRHQPEAFELARSLAELEAARAMVEYARELDREYEWGLTGVWVATALRNLAQTLTFTAGHYGLGDLDRARLDALEEWAADQLSTPNLARLAGQMFERRTEPAGGFGLSRDHVEMSQIFSRFADERVAPVAERIHREDLVIPEDLLQELAELGVFGISIPEEYGGNFVDHLTMCLATEQLSHASLGAGGSVITRPEICAKALLKGGSEAQKQQWLPRIASGERIVCIAVTEPNAGSDVAALRVTARRTDGGYVINGEKTWCTFAGRADLFALLARTGAPDSGHRGLTLFLVEKPAAPRDDNMDQFVFVQPGGGRVEGHAIPTVGYRGMHSYSVTFEDFFVPEENRVGAEGEGFVLQMQGFAGGRIQTASRAVGLMQAALEKALQYAREREVFGRALGEYSLPQAKLVAMAATVQACRQLSYAVARMMDEGKGQMEASLVKLMSCKQAEWVAREAMQLHGGMGYSEEYAVSRYWQDARVLSIFEGAEEVLALYVVARGYLRGLIEGVEES